MKLHVTAIAFSVFVVLALNSCKKEQPETTTYLRAPLVEYTKQDTVEIQTKVSEYVEHLKNGEYQECADMLYFLRNDSVFPLTAEKKQEFISAMNMLPIQDAQLSTLVLRSDINNEMDVKVLLKVGGDIDSEEGVTHFFLNPIVKEGKWYITLVDENAEGHDKIYERK